MRSLTLLMSAFAIVFAASCGNASATAINSGQDYDVGIVYDATDAVSVNAEGFMVAYEYRCNCKESATVSVLTIHKEAYPATVDVGAFGYVNDASVTAPLFIETDDYKVASHYKPNTHFDSTDTASYRCARDGLTNVASV